MFEDPLATAIETLFYKTPGGKYYNIKMKLSLALCNHEM